MALMAYRLMMGSGVLRPGAREIRREAGGLPLYATRPMPEFLESVFGISFGPELKPNQRKKPERDGTSRRSLKTFLAKLGTLRPSGQPPVQERVSEQEWLEERVRILESLLKAERALCRTQGEELAKLRTDVKRLDMLEADLSIERESGKQLVHWLEEAEAEVAEVRDFFRSIPRAGA